VEKKLTIEIERDPSPFDPRENDNLFSFAFFHRRFNLGDTASARPDGQRGVDEFMQWLSDARKKDTLAYIRTVYGLNHSCFHVSLQPFNDAWDSNQLGAAYVTREKALRLMNWKCLTKKRRQLLHEILESEIKEYDQYLNSEVYEYIIRDESGEILATKGGYYDEQEAMDAATVELRWL
jgi:hypothetical protein